MEIFDNKEGFEKNNRNEVFSNAIRAGRRTYFFDVKTTKNKDHYLTITESKKSFDEDGNPKFEKHKVFLYKEDFDKFSDGLEEALNFIRSTQGETDKQIGVNENLNENLETTDGLDSKTFSNIEFEDLSE